MKQPREVLTGETPGSPIPPGIFRAYDIRGIAGSELCADRIRRIGRAIGRLARENGRRTLLFGADGRLSSAELAPALYEGILASGCDIVDLGLIPTPLLYFATHTTEHDSGVMLTASHNPAEYNGIKMVLGRHSLTPEQIQYLYRLSNGDDPLNGTRPGRYSRRQIAADYIQRLSHDIRLARPLKLVVDCGNAVPGLLAPELFEALGCEVIPLFCELDGRFPNHHPDPTDAANLVELTERIGRENADLGIALDGDGDRVVIVTNAGTAIDTDRLLMLLVRAILPRYPGADVVFDVKCSQLLTGIIEECGGRPVLSRSGHSFMNQKMRETGAVVGGEFSAHIFIRDRWYGYDDGLYVAARFLELLAGQEDCAETLHRGLPASVSTPELRIPVSEQRKFPLMQTICESADFPGARINHLDGLRAEFPHGWGLLRASNTTPALLLRFEADTPEALQDIQSRFRELLHRTDSSLDPGF